MIEFVFAASPETIPREPQDYLSITQSAICRTWQPARCVMLSFSVSRGLGYRGAEIFCWHKGALGAIHCSKYVTIFLATAIVARFVFPFSFAFS